MRTIPTCAGVAVVLALPITLGTAGTTQAQSIDTTTLGIHARILAHDSLEGRANGTPGQETAAAYIERQLQRLRLEPAGDHGTFRQAIPLVRVDVDRQRSRLTLRRSAGDTTFGSPAVLHLGGDSAAFRSFSGDAVFGGSTVEALRRIPRAGNVADRVVVVTAGAPGSANALADSLAARGAAALVVILPQSEALARLANARGPSRFFLRTGTGARTGTRLPVVAVAPEVSVWLDLERALPSPSDTLPFVRLPAAVGFTLVATFVPIRAQNILARLPGRDPARAHEAVVLMAHYDHIGISAPLAGDSIYNGFIDNAVGTSAVLAIARALRDVPLRRSVVFLLTAAEEEGSLGSAHFVAHPTVPLDRIVAAVNLDGGAPLAPPRSWILQGGSGSVLDSAARRVAAQEGWTVTALPPRFSSDQWRFHERGVASTLLLPGEGWEGVTPDEERRLIQRWWRAHRPDDEWEPGFAWDGLQRYATFALQVVREVAGPASGR